MSHLPTSESTFWAQAVQADLLLATERVADGCSHCGGPVHRADYPRKPRGCPNSADLPAGFETRFALCCGQQGCRKRAHVPQIRFLDRKVYGLLSILLTVAARTASPPRKQTSAAMCRALGCSRRTIERWLSFWRDRFPSSWRGTALRAKYAFGARPVALALVEHFAAWEGAGAQLWLSRSFCLIGT